MRFYPHGSGSIPSISVSASVSLYALTSSFTTTIKSASRALTGSIGPQGPAGSCIYQAGPQGSQGPQGPQGPIGTVNGPNTTY